MDEILDGISQIDCDILVIGGGTAGPMAALKAKRKNPEANVVLLDKANVKRSGAISMGMDGLNNTIIPGHATPEQYTKEITIANDGIVDQAPIYRYAEECYDIIQELDSFGIRFQKDQNGEYDVKKVHHIGTYVLPMPNGDTVKKALYRQLRKARINITNRYMATRLLQGEGRIAGAICVNTRTSEFLVVRAKAVVMCLGAAGRLGLPTSGYLYGTYENATNSGEGYSMAYHAGAGLANLECYQINPLIKDYNGPACAYVAGPMGGYTANAEGERFIECDYWSGQMMQERIPGVDLANIFTFRDFGDTEALLSRSFSARNALVVGGGLLGLEAARGLSGRGANVTVVEHEVCLMPSQLDTTAAALLKERIEALGITVLTGTRVKQFTGSDRVEAAQFEGLAERAFDTVVICTGVRANTQLASGAELAVGRGIKVDALMRSSDPDIYAIGECAEVDGYVTGLVGPGFEQANVAVENIVTQSTQTKFKSTIDACKLKVIGVDVFSMGDFASAEQQSNVKSHVYHAPEEQIYRRILLRRGKIIAALGVGDWPDVAKVQTACARETGLHSWHLRRFKNTGLIWPASEESALNLPSDAIICNCTGVTKGAIRNAITLGASTPQELQLATSCSTVCGTCKPLVAELLGQDSAPEPVRWFQALTYLSGIAAIIALLSLLAPRIPLAETFSNDDLFRSLWFDSLWKQYSGYTLLGLTTLAALIGLRKRISFLSKLGGYDFWRITHLGIGLTTALVLVWHTGFRIGSNLNLVLMLAFLTVLIFGAIAGLATGKEHDLAEKGLSSAKKPARRLPLWVHIIGLWPLPILIIFHVLVVYAY